MRILDHKTPVKLRNSLSINELCTHFWHIPDRDI
jgi:hypothetical protein